MRRCQRLALRRILRSQRAMSAWTERIEKRDEPGLDVGIRLEWLASTVLLQKLLVVFVCEQQRSLSALSNGKEVGMVGGFMSGLVRQSRMYALANAGASCSRKHTSGSAPRIQCTLPKGPLPYAQNFLFREFSLSRAKCANRHYARGNNTERGTEMRPGDGD